MVSMVALGILIVIETICLPSILILLCVFRREDRMAKLYPQESVRIGSAGSYILSCFFVLVYIPLCLVLLGWHANLDNHPLACLSLFIPASTLSMSSLCNMLYMSTHFAFTILRPLNVDAIFTRRRSLISYIITVCVIPIIAATVWIVLILTQTKDFYEDHIVCLAFPAYWPRWTLQVTTFGFLIPVTSVSFATNSYLSFIARKQAIRTIHAAMDQQPVPVSSTTAIQMNRENGNGASQNRHVQSSDGGNSSTWKGTRLIYMNILAAFLFLIPTYSLTGTISLCQDCLPPETALVLLLTVFSVTPLGPVFYSFSNPRVREIIKKDVVLLCRGSNQK